MQLNSSSLTSFSPRTVLPRDISTSTLFPVAFLSSSPSSLEPSFLPNVSLLGMLILHLSHYISLLLTSSSQLSALVLRHGGVGYHPVPHRRVWRRTLPFLPRLLWSRPPRHLHSLLVASRGLQLLPHLASWPRRCLVRPRVPRVHLLGRVGGGIQIHSMVLGLGSVEGAQQEHGCIGCCVGELGQRQLEQ